MSLVSVLSILVVAMIVIAIWAAVWRKLKAGAERINEYFAQAVCAWLLHGDLAARLAALVAMKVAVPETRESMIRFLTVAVATLAESEERRKSFEQQIAILIVEARLRNWNLDDVGRAKEELAGIDGAYARALDLTEPSIFRSRWPDLGAT